jgi:Leucine-rich repeat (LRR) protein
LVNLRKLSLSNNNLGEFPEIILKFSKLYSLKLKNTKLRNIPDDIIKHLPDLEELDISKNELTSLPLSLSASKKLTERKFKYDKDKVKVPDSLKWVVKAFNETVTGIYLNI